MSNTAVPLFLKRVTLPDIEFQGLLVTCRLLDVGLNMTFDYVFIREAIAFALLHIVINNKRQALNSTNKITYKHFHLLLLILRKPLLSSYLSALVCVQRG